MLLIYTEETSRRFSFVIEHIFTHILGVEYFVTEDITKIRSSKDTFINYSTTPLEKGIQIVPHGLLSNLGIENITPQVDQWEELPIFFTTNEGAKVPFDIFSASFYLISRYEEYRSKALDEHGRFLHTESLAFKNHFLQKPLVDIWANKLKEILLQQAPYLHFSPPVFCVTPTLDIDNLFAYKHRGLLRTIGASVREILQKDFKQFRVRYKVLLGIIPDPFNNIKEVITLHKQCKILPVFFLHFGTYGAHDKYTLLPRTEWKEFNSAFFRPYTIGLHPSYKAAFDAKCLEKEKERMYSVLRVNPTINRFHYLRFRLPESYLMLRKLHFREDFSMIYSKELGFRASTSFPCYFYDLDRDRKTKLLVHSPCVMDVTLKNSLGLNPEEAYAKILALMQEVKAVGGEFIPIFHNESLSNIGEWQGWLDIYRKFLRQTMNKNNAVFQRISTS